MQNYTRVFSLLATTLILSACGAVAPTPETSRPDSDSASVQASSEATKTLPACTPNDVFILAETDRVSYRPGTTVNITSTIINLSNHACSLGVGPLAGVSPLVSVNDASGNQLWSNCYVTDQHGACYTFWNFQTLAAGAIWSRSFTWDQGTNEPADGAVHRIPDGVYSVTTSYASVGAISDPVYIKITG